MTQNQQAAKRKPGTPGPLSRWFQRTMNARTRRKIHAGRDKLMGMDVLVLQTLGRRSGELRETPLAWFPDGEDAWLVVASGGGSQHPDWHANLMAHPTRAAVAFPGRDPLPVSPETLEGPDRTQAWQRITSAQPRLAKYQAKSSRQYPVIRLTPR
ncbi:nitroreductase family deazaflavin-dependent oxidoreductase [Kribbella turkmenica]|uniref:Nitroreductase family deazaflavin-dependent oxidoreductase n=1 Tax=Kribbella turkmenica TaxID=2530375 RepID=A0A4R4W1S8_9ACTN|nr:nitroreductase family deazaflavin-dependent oxidoreductase [Kribbella turkmenica]TDD12412.1 nitroreductase family deazaflavin-dependent oxidoreductase [Kribbella turkmenica]